MKFIAATAACPLAAGMLLLQSVAAQSETLVMQSAYASTLPVIGEAGVRLTEQVKTMTGGALNIEFHEPGAIVAGNEIWDAISTGAVDAGWYAPGFAQSVIPAAPIFTTVPFGPDVREYTAWWYHGGGRELWAELTEPYNIHSELCAVLVPAASGWFAKPIDKVDDLAGVRVRIFGLGALVMERLGARPQAIMPAETMTGLRLGTIDAAEMSFPALDLALGLNEYANYYYFPGWAKQTVLATFIVNRDVWNGLSEAERSVIEHACAANVTFTSAQGEAIQVPALQQLRDKGVDIRRWSDEMMQTYRKAWEEVVAEQAAANPDFARAWKSLSEFRENFRIWSDIAYIE